MSPAVRGAVVPHGLVRLQEQPGLVVDLAYAGADNFLGRRLYPTDSGAWLWLETLQALLRVVDDLSAHGLGVVVLDAYRPLGVQSQMWQAFPDRRYVSDPAENLGRHSRGTAVDLGPIDATGARGQWPSGFDDFTEISHRDSVEDWGAEARRVHGIMDEAMNKHGFVGLPTEWWHYDLVGWENRPALDVSFEELSLGLGCTEEMRLGTRDRSMADAATYGAGAPQA